MNSVARVVALGFRAGLALLAVRHAAAQTERSLDFALAVVAPEGAACTPAAQLRGDIESQVGRLVFTEDPRPSRRIDIAITRDAAADAWSAAIEMRDSEGRSVGARNIVASGPSCAARSRRSVTRSRSMR